jgi:hypothetical protein
MYFRKSIWLGLILVLSTISVCRADSLWFNGDIDPNGAGGWSNEINTTVSDSRIYENFNVTDAQGWTISQMWSDDLIVLTGTSNHSGAGNGWIVESAEWSLRSGVSQGNGGTVIASGISSVTQTFLTTFNLGNYNVYQIMVSDLSIYLPQGQYWLNVTPIGTGPGTDPNAEPRSFLAVTNGSGAIGPTSTPDDSFVDSTYYGVSFQPGVVQFGRGNDNFSMGVAGHVGISEPSSCTLMLAGFSCLAFIARRQHLKSNDLTSRFR